MIQLVSNTYFICELLKGAILLILQLTGATAFCAPEDTNHFLLKCIKYEVPRINSRPSVTEILAVNQQIALLDGISLYLCGHFSLNCLHNKNILLSTIKIIKNTIVSRNIPLPPTHSPHPLPSMVYV